MNRIVPIPHRDVKLTDPFLTGRRALVKDNVLPYQWEALNDRIDGAEKSYAIHNFRVAAGEAEGEFGGMVFQDSDLAKWIEAAAHILADAKDPTLLENVREVVRLIAKAQREDGYLNTYFILKDPAGRFTDLRDSHELYCAGHFIEAAVALWEATGEDSLLHTMERYVDLIASTFGPGEGQRRGYPGHEEIELALIKLYRATGKKKYLDLASYFVEERGQTPNYFIKEGKAAQHYFPGNTAQGMAYFQAHAPIREQRDAVGHSVRAMYLYSAVADLAAETGDKSLHAAARRLWESTTRRRMYVTGGIGSTDTGERFTFDYHLPNDSAYAETCAAIGLVFFAHRMLQLEPLGEYGDVLERALYGGVLSGISQDGTRFFYVNPLEVWPEAVDTQEDLRHVKRQRQPWFGCACCPPNIARLLASIGEYLLGVRGEELYVHLYAACQAQADVGGRRVPVVIQGNYPWSGEIQIAFPQGMDGALNLRIPAWSRAWQVKREGKALEGVALEGGYARIEGPFAPGERVELSLDMTPYRVWAHPSVRHDGGRVAIMRGPVCYCLEQADNGPELQRLTLPREAPLQEGWIDGLFGGLPTVFAQGLGDALEGDLYAATPPRNEPRTLTFVPYFAWNNRGDGEMAVWVRESAGE